MMPDFKNRSDNPAKPLSASELEQDAGHGVASDETVEGESTNTHLPASEADMLKNEDVGRPDKGLTPPPPD